MEAHTLRVRKLVLFIITSPIPIVETADFIVANVLVSILRTLVVVDTSIVTGDFFADVHIVHHIGQFRHVVTIHILYVAFGPSRRVDIWEIAMQNPGGRVEGNLIITEISVQLEIFRASYRLSDENLVRDSGW